LDDYFVDGEHPYHHGVASVASSDSAALLDDAVARQSVDPISSIAKTFCDGIVAERDALIAAMAGLASGTPCAPAIAPEKFAAAVGTQPDDRGDGVLLINPHSTGVRQLVTMAGPPAKADHIFGMTKVSGGVAVSVDVPAGGFVTLRSRGNAGGSPKSSVGTWLRNKWLGKPTSIAENGRLQNEFLDVTVQPESGGIAGVLQRRGGATVFRCGSLRRE
jgi:hypothetical protein